MQLGEVLRITPENYVRILTNAFQSVALTDAWLYQAFERVAFELVDKYQNAQVSVRRVSPDLIPQAHPMMMVFGRLTIWVDHDGNSYTLTVASVDELTHTPHDDAISWNMYHAGGLTHLDPLEPAEAHTMYSDPDNDGIF